MEELFSDDVSFESIGLRPELLKALDKAGYRKPTIIQAQLIPIAMTGRDVLGQSKTGTGKTAAFGLPILHQLEDDKPFQAIMLVPTRELAVQVTSELSNLSHFMKCRIASVYGGQRMRKQISRLKAGPEVIVGTPGRVMDMHQRDMLPYDSIRFAVLDEVDRMLDIGFRDDIRRILGQIKHEHQTIFVSATISSSIEQLTAQYMRNPYRLDVTSASSLTVSQVQQKYFHVKPWDKKRLLKHLLEHEEPALTIVFCRTKQTVDNLAMYLKKSDISVHAIHGDMYQGKRNRVMSQFRSGELSVLIASDLAARGLDVDDISHVINYDLPEDPEIYVHRIGRTARAGKDGIAWSFVSPDQGKLLTAIEMLTNVEIPLQEYPDFKPGPVPKDVLLAQEREDARASEPRVQSRRVPLTPPARDEAKDAERFPGGIVPIDVPTNRMHGKVRTRRR